MKILYVEFKIFCLLLVAALLLGIITVTPCALGKKGSLLGRCYGVDACRFGELTGKMKDCICRHCGK